MGYGYKGGGRSQLGQRDRRGAFRLGHRDPVSAWKARLDRGDIPLIVFLYGEDEGRLLSFMNLLRTKCLDETTRPFNLSRFDAEEIPLERILDAARTFPVLSPRRMVVVDNASSFGQAEWEGMIPYLRRPSPSTCLVLRGDSRPDSPEVVKAIQDVGAVLEFKRCTERQAEEWIVDTVRNAGKRIPLNVARVLIGEVGTMQGALEGEVEKLLLYASDKATIGEEDVREVTVGAKSHKIFDLTDALGERREVDALRILHTLLDEKDSHLKILGMLARQVRMIWHTKDSIQSGRDVSSSQGKLPAFARARLLKQTHKWEEASLRRALEGLGDLDRAFKGGMLAPEVLLDKWILEVCQGSQALGSQQTLAECRKGRCPSGPPTNG